MQRIKIAIQKSGRLNEESLSLLKKCGINIDNYKDQLKASSVNFPIDVFFLRNSDIPQYIIDGIVDVAIIGENLIIENDNKIDIIERLGFSKCKVSIAVPNKMEFNSIMDLNDLKIATSYPNTLNNFLNKESIKARTHVINGSVEIAPNIGLSDAICDIVSSGSTLYKNNLKEVYVIHYSEAVLAVSNTIDKKSNELRLFKKGTNKIAQKVGEEAIELVIESKDDDNERLFLNEGADLLFHYLILLQEKGYKLNDVLNVLKLRNKFTTKLK